MDNKKAARDAGQRCHSGVFSLLEFIITLAIIGVLLAILLPALGKARGAARKISCVSNLRQAGVAALAYSSDHDGFLPPCNPYQRLIRGIKGYAPEPLVAYGFTPNLARCSEYGGPGLQASYKWRFVLDVSNGFTYPLPLPSDTNQKRIVSDAASVLGYCVRHLSSGARGETYSWTPNERAGFYNVLRADGSVKPVQASTVLVWCYEPRGAADPWYESPSNGFLPSRDLHPWQYYDVFPGETWPPVIAP